MKNRLFLLLGIEHGEESLITLLFTQSVFLGIFYGAFDISAHSLFLSIFDEKMMARGYVVSGLAGIILTSVYTSLQTRMPFRNFAVANLSFVTTLTLVLWVLLLINPAKWIIFLVFIMLGPMNILALLGFWGTASRIFNLRQGKRLFGLIDAGLVIGIILSCYAIPVLLSLRFRSHNILLISAAALLTATILQTVVGSRFLSSQVKDQAAAEKREKKKSVLSLFREDKYIRILGIFIALSVMTAFFVQYSFMAVTRQQYPSEDDMARFLGLFTGSMMIFTLIIKLFAFAYLIRNYGLRTCLALSPILVAAFTIIAVVIGILMGFTPATSGFMLFFMLLALSRLFSKSLKDSIESPSFKVIYLTIDEKIRYEVQSAMDGTVNEIAALSSGLILAGLGILSFIRLIHFSIVLIFITGMWIMVAFRVYTGYRKSIRKALETGSSPETNSVTTPGDQNRKSLFAAEIAFRDNYFSLACGDYKCLDKYPGNNLPDIILNHSESRQDISMIPLLKKLASDQAFNTGIKQRSATVAESLEHLMISGHPDNEKYFSSLKLFTDSRQPQTTQVLRLLRDNSDESKAEGIMLIGKFRITEMLPDVCECLNNPGLRELAADILKSFGSKAYGELQKYFMISSGNTEISKAILYLLAEGCSPENQAFIFSRLWSGSREVKEVAATLLAGCDYRSPDEEKDHIHQLISDTIGIMVWNLSARICIEKSNNTVLLKAINEEINRWNAYLFNLLSIAFDSGSIMRIRESLESGTVESINYALEMIDIVIDESIKPKLIPLLDIIPDENKVKALYQFFPGEVPDYAKLVENILNRDYNLLGIWIRACAIRDLPGIKGETLAESLIALLFSPEEILQEESARLIERSDRETYRLASVRINAKTRESLSRILSTEASSMELLYEKVSFMSKRFSGTDEDHLLKLAGSLKFIREIRDWKLQGSGRFILWPLPDSEQDEKAFIAGQGKEPEGITGIIENGSYYFLPLDAVREFIFMYPEKSSAVLNYIEIKELEQY
ncbi:MAG: Npt1/Npt2 family nucleotide transporter [Bacteroidales bacterium]|jgi:ATP/ADP translocase